MSEAQLVLKVTDLRTQFDTQDGMVHAVNGVSFDLKKGEFLGVVGESGSGKSVTMMSLLRLIPAPPGEIVAGEAIFQDEDLLTLDIEGLKQVRGGKIGFIFQDPMTSLNPVLTIGRQIEESLEQAGRHPRRQATPQGLPPRAVRRNATACDDRNRPRL